MYNFLRNCQTVSKATALNSQQQCKKVLISTHPPQHFFFLFKNYLFIYLFLAELGLCCWAQAFSSCGEQGLLFIAVRGLLIAVASLVAEHQL